MNKNKWISSLCVLESCKLIPLKEHSKVPQQKNWNSPVHIPLPKLHPMLENNNYGVVCGLPSDGLWVIDTDNEKASESIFSLLKKYGIETLIVKTCRGYHFYFKSPYIMATTKSKHLEIDIKAQNSFVVGALSINSATEHTYLIHHQKPVHKLYLLDKDQSFLTDLETLLGKKLYIKRKLSSNLKKRFQSLGEEKSTSEQELNIILELVTKKYSQKEINYLLHKYLHSQSHLFQYKNQKDKDSYIEKSIQKAINIQIESQKAIQKNKELQPLNILQLKMPATSKKILLTMIKKSNGKTTTKISYRNLMKEAAIGSIKTIQKNINYLIDNHYIEKIQTSEYQIKRENFPKNTTILNTFNVRTLSLNIDPLLRKSCVPYLFSHGILGSSCFFILIDVLIYFQFTAFRVSDLLSNNSSFVLSSLYRNLNKMVRLKLLVKNSKYYSLSSNFIDILIAYAQSDHILSKEKSKIDRLENEQKVFELKKLFYIAYQRGHYSLSVWNKLKFTMSLFSVDYYCMKEIFYNEYMKDVV